ncbi:putative nicotinate phosphoribosyltransferase [compost metagenome]
MAGVADTYDPFRYTRWVGTDFKERIIKSGGTFVVRPDSGDATVIPIQIIQMLMEDFGYTVNSKGYKVLPDCIRVLQGDGVNRATIRIILQKMKDLGLSADNIVFGMGGALLQHCDRDWMKFAMKGSALEVNGQWKDLYKDPITDSIKRSKKGRVTTYKDQAGEYFSDRLELQEVNHNIEDQLVDFYLNGDLLVDESFTVIRARLKAQ